MAKKTAVTSAKAMTKTEVGLSWEPLFAACNIAQGRLVPLGLLTLFFGPMIASKSLERR